MVEVCVVLGWFEDTELEYCDPTTSQGLGAHSWLCFGFIIPHKWLWLGEDLSHQKINHNLMLYYIFESRPAFKMYILGGIS